MNLPEWCQTHSLKEFLTLLEDEDIFRTSSPNKGKNMENVMETMGSVELVSSETSGYIGPDGQFVYGEPPVDAGKEVYVQTDEDVIAD